MRTTTSVLEGLSLFLWSNAADLARKPGSAVPDAAPSTVSVLSMSRNGASGETGHDCPLQPSTGRISIAIQGTEFFRYCRVHEPRNICCDVLLCQLEHDANGSHCLQSRTLTLFVC